jgi:cytochrome c oxidase subunit 2
VKHDVVPGRTTIAWFEATKAGRFPIRCAEMCGRDHARMAAEVIVLEPDAYTAWKDAATDVELGEARPSMAEQGRVVAAEKECLACHTIDGTAHIGPTWVGLYGSPVRLTDGRVVLADEAYLTRSMMDPDVDITAGFEPLMPSFQGRLTNWEAASLVELIRSLRDGSPAREVTP